MKTIIKSCELFIISNCVLLDVRSLGIFAFCLAWFSVLLMLEDGKKIVAAVQLLVLKEESCTNRRWKNTIISRDIKRKKRRE